MPRGNDQSKFFHAVYCTKQHRCKSSTELSAKRHIVLFRPKPFTAVYICMKQTTRNLIDGLEASRRVGWAKYYALQTENQHLKWLIRLLVRRIVFHSRLNNEDPLVILAKELERSDWS